MIDDEDKLKQYLIKAKDAENFINHPNFVNSKTLIRAELFKQFEKTKPNDTETMAEIRRKLQALDWLEQAFFRAIRDGKLAEQKLLDKIKEKFN